MTCGHLQKLLNPVQYIKWGMVHISRYVATWEKLLRQRKGGMSSGAGASGGGLGGRCCPALHGVG